MVIFVILPTVLELQLDRGGQFHGKKKKHDGKMNICSVLSFITTQVTGSHYQHELGRH